MAKLSPEMLAQITGIQAPKLMANPELAELDLQVRAQYPPKIPHPGKGASPEQITEWRSANALRTAEIRRLRAEAGIPRGSLSDESPPQSPPEFRSQVPNQNPGAGTNSTAGSSAKIRVHSTPVPKAPPEPEAIPTGEELFEVAVDEEKLALALQGIAATANICFTRGTDIWLMEDDEAMLIASSAAQMATRSAITRKAIDAMPAVYLVLGLSAYFVKNVPDTIEHRRGKRGNNRRIRRPVSADISGGNNQENQNGNVSNNDNQRGTGTEIHSLNGSQPDAGGSSDTGIPSGSSDQGIVRNVVNDYMP